MKKSQPPAKPPRPQHRKVLQVCYRIQEALGKVFLIVLYVCLAGMLLAIIGGLGARFAGIEEADYLWYLLGYSALGAVACAILFAIVAAAINTIICVFYPDERVRAGASVQQPSGNTANIYRAASIYQQRQILNELHDLNDHFLQ